MSCRFPGSNQKGFTLIEVLVALVVTGLVMTVFFQLLSAGVRLEYKAVVKTKDVLELKRILREIQAGDVQDKDFEWQKGKDGHMRVLRIEPVETLKLQAESDESIRLSSELYRYVVEYTDNEKKWTVVRYICHDPDYFSEDFKNRHFN